MGLDPSVHPEYAEILVRWGIDAISVNPDAVEVTRRHIAAAEQKLILEEARGMAAARNRIAEAALEGPTPDGRPGAAPAAAPRAADAASASSRSR